MSDHLEFSQHLTSADFDQAIRETFLGQAHFAGTGPSGKTCRECLHWRMKGKDPSVGYYSKSHKVLANQLKRAHCTYPMPHKADRCIPHTAKACRFFSLADAVPPISNPETRA